MPNGTLLVYASFAGQAAPLPGVQLAVLDESGAVVARLVTDASGASEALSLPAPDASYSLDENNQTVQPYSVYRLTAQADGWQTQLLDGVLTADGICGCNSWKKIASAAVGIGRTSTVVDK